ncbi:MAG: MerR family transcriptional regulator [Desulfovibrio aminophilus]|mgnify:CR=1 FL=1|jgi:DNA-binding transcriptional MerR regulator|uniref:MerR family transcriptional regulator n=1 Tax=Desulfovibrio aminophilus TaxID=81425 RepID=UPI002A493BF4|nr:MerR family transcriptional regulator [Desulfovibrionaceae bacterium]
MDGKSGSKTYKIGQAAELLGIKPFVLRFWEGEFPQLEPLRTASGQRMYSEEQLGLVREIKHLLYDEGLTIEGARKRLEEKGPSDLLREVRDELLAIRDLLAGKDGSNTEVRS